MKRSIMIVPLALFVAFMVAVIMLERAETERHQNKLRLNIFYELSAIQSRFEAALSAKLNILRGIEAVLAGAPDLDSEQLDTLTRTLVYGQSGINAIIITRDKTITHAYPEKAHTRYAGVDVNLALPKDFSSILQNSIARRSLVVAGPGYFFRDRKSIVAAIPIFLHQKNFHDSGPFWGTAAIIMDPTPLFLEAGLIDSSPNLNKALKVPGNNEGGWEMAHGDMAVFANDPVVMNILLAQGYWQLAAIPETGWGASPSSLYVYVVGTMLALALSLGLWFTLHQVRARILAREEYFHLVHNARSIILRLDVEGRISFINEYALSFYGFEREEIIGRPFVGTLSPEFGFDGKNIATMINRLIRNPGSFPTYEIESVKKNGDIVWISWSTRPSNDPNGNLDYILCVGTDVTKRRQMEEALRRSESKYRLLTENVTDVIWGLDANLHFTYISPSDKNLRGFEAFEVLGKPLWEFVAPGSKKELLKVVAGLDQTLRKGQDPPAPLTISLEMLCKDDTTVWAETRATILYNDDGHMIGMQGVIRDISDRIRAEALREDMERIARHDLKTPLGAVIGLPGEIADKGNLNAQQLDMLDVIKKAGDSMLELINRSLELYKMETGTYELDLTRIDLLELIELIGAESRPMLRRKGVSIGIETPDDAEEFPIMAERPLLHSMLSNLIKNAVEASPEGGTIRIDLRRQDGIRLAIRNSGGVPENIQDIFFDKYSKSTNSKGSGLGTYSLRLIARTHGGEARLDTSVPGETTVRVFLPDRPLR